MSGSSILRCWLGYYEYDKQTLIADFTKRGMVAWDIGANVGFYTLAFSRLVGPSGAVYSFEPYASNVVMLLRHVCLNMIENVRVIQAALSGGNGIESFQISKSHAQGRLGADGSTLYNVPTFSPDSFLEKFPAARPDVIKIDVEGAECLVLKGAERLLRGSSPLILLALHGADKATQCFDILKDFGFTCFAPDGKEIESASAMPCEIYAKKRS